jgi:TolB protein
MIMLLYGGAAPDLEQLVSGIHVIGVDGTDMRQLTEDEASSWSPSWSPDGQQIVFTSDRDGDADIYVMNVDGSGVTALTDNADEGDYTPSW